MGPSSGAAPVLLGVILCLPVAACGAGASAPPIIDGWSVGEAVDCAAEHDCATMLTTALAKLDETEPGHGQVVRSELHRESYYLDRRTGNKILATTSGGGCSIVVLEISGGRTSAIGVCYPGVSRIPMAFREGPAETLAH
jgi:hypothetical protein